jgi:hypothetical protein
MRSRSQLLWKMSCSYYSIFIAVRYLYINDFEGYILEGLLDYFWRYVRGSRVSKGRGGRECLGIKYHSIIKIVSF